MKKMKYVFALSLLFSTALRADDSELLARLVVAAERAVVLAERSEVRAQEVEAYVVRYAAAVQGFFIQMVIPQLVKDKRGMNPEQQEGLTQIVKIAGALVGLTSEQIQESIMVAEAKNAQEASDQLATNQRVLSNDQLTAMALEAGTVVIITDALSGEIEGAGTLFEPENPTVLGNN